MNKRRRYKAKRRRATLKLWQFFASYLGERCPNNMATAHLRFSRAKMHTVFDDLHFKSTVDYVAKHHWFAEAYGMSRVIAVSRRDTEKGADSQHVTS